MSKNPHIPQLFRDIFKGAFLPYNDPRTLSLFLKEINEFNYEHSENLGNAFEYLLSILGSQGDAGQFRTPRHIIDFIVEVVDPKKNETILDPACGTAGFLISAYKHILKTNKEKPLTPDEKLKLMNNLAGYDISPDMVRLALVNMYLHGFPEPKIHEYDTLSSEKRWDETFDVILANPPFMTPKGGIIPHKRFQVKANRAEVLFVDYIMEHLKPKGRAGIIVPEGIIFQSATAYKNLRKALIEDGLYAVVSLPAGVFNPYSGVKTSILFFNNELAKKTDEILFVKVENDGFDLGAQRRPVDKNDLPEMVDILLQWRDNQKIDDSDEDVLDLGDGANLVTEKNEKFALKPKKYVVVKKSKIAESGDYNLTGDRYRETVDYSNVKWPMVELGEVCKFVGGYAFKSNELKNVRENQNDLPVIKIGNVDRSGILNVHDTQYFTYQDFLNKYLINQDDILIAMTGATVGKVAYSQFDNLLLNQRVGLVRAIEKKINKSFLKSILLSDKFYKYCQLQAGGGAQGNISPSQIKKYIIPLPPLEIQEQIVAELNSCQKVIDGAQQVVENWKPTIKIDSGWKKVKLGEVCEIKSGGTPLTGEVRYYENGDIPWLKSEVCKDGIVTESKNFISEEGLKNSSAKWLIINTTLIALVGATIGKTALLKFNATTNQNIAGLFPKNIKYLNPIYLFYSVQTLYPKFLDLGKGKFKMANLSFVKNLDILIPDLKIQEKIVEKIESERKIVEQNKKLIEIFEKKIKDKIDEVWGR